MKYYVYFALILIISACKAPEINTLQPKPCDPLQATISSSANPQNEKDITYSIEKTSGSIKNVTWLIKGDSVKNGALQISTVYPADGNYSVTAILQDSCNTVVKIEKSLNLQKICKPLAGEITYEASESDSKNINFALKNVSGSIRNITWVIQGDSLKNNLTETTKTFSKDGDYQVEVVLLDSCNKFLSLKTNLNITTYVAIPDTAFENRLIALGIDSEKVQDGRIKESDAKSVSRLDFLSGIGITPVNADYRGNIKNLSGIEAFSNLTYLDCSRQQIEEISLHQNTKLKILKCHTNGATRLDVDKNVLLEIIYCWSNKFDSLNLAFNTNLIELACSQNELTTLNLGSNTLLESIFCQNNLLTAINISNSILLTSLSCYNNKLLVLDIANNLILDRLDAQQNSDLKYICVNDLEVAKNKEEESVEEFNSTKKFIKDSHTQWSTCEGSYLPGSSPTTN